MAPEEVAITVKNIMIKDHTMFLIPLNRDYDIESIDLSAQSILDIVFGVVRWVGREIDTKKKIKVPKRKRILKIQEALLDSDIADPLGIPAFSRKKKK